MNEMSTKTARSIDIFGFERVRYRLKSSILPLGVDLVKGDDDSFSSEGVDEAAIAAKPFL